MAPYTDDKQRYSIGSDTDDEGRSKAARGDRQLWEHNDAQGSRYAPLSQHRVSSDGAPSAEGSLTPWRRLSLPLFYGDVDDQGRGRPFAQRHARPLLILQAIAWSLVLVLWLRGRDVSSVSHESQASARSHGDMFAAGGPNAKIGIHSLMVGTGSRHEHNAADQAKIKSQLTFSPVRTPEQMNTSHVFSEQELLSLSLGTVKRYAEQWGHPFWIARQPMAVGPAGPGTSILWTKESMTLSLLLDELRKPEAERLEWILYVDADYVITNTKIPLETFLPPIVDKDALVQNYNDSSIQAPIILTTADLWNSMNSGAYMVRVCQESVKFFTMLEAEGIEHWNQYHDQGEQSALARIASSDKFIDQVVLVPARFFNADAFKMFGYFSANDASYEMGDFSLHFMSGSKGGWDQVIRWTTSDTYHYRNASMEPPLAETDYARDGSVASIKASWDAWYSGGAEKRRKRIRSCKTE